MSLPEDNHPVTTQDLPPFSLLLFDVRPIFSCPNHLKFQPDHSILGRQHRRKYCINRARLIKNTRFNQHLHHFLKPEFS